MAQQQNTNLSSQDGNSKKGISPAIIVCIILLAVIVILSVVLVKFLTTKPVTPSDVSSGRGILVTPDNVEELIAKAETEANTDAAYTASMNIDWYFEDGASPTSNGYVENHVSNSRTVYFDLALAETSEIVYSSPYIPVGSTLTDFALDKDLTAGDYSAIMVYHLVDDDYNEVSTVSVTVTLHILN